MVQKQREDPSAETVSNAVKRRFLEEFGSSWTEDFHSFVEEVIHRCLHRTPPGSTPRETLTMWVKRYPGRGASQSRIARELGIPRETVNRALQELIKRRIIRRVPNRGEDPENTGHWEYYLESRYSPADDLFPEWEQ
jgi:hypothetical protein